MIRQTHTYAVLEIPKRAYDFMKEALANAGYQHAFHSDSQHPDLIDMHGIAVAPLLEDVREYRFKCGNPDGNHEWSVMAKPTFDIDFNPLCMADGCSYNGSFVGENPAENNLEPFGPPN